jgi:hypothetical protein
LFIQFNSLSSFFFIRSPSFVIAPHLVGDSFPVVSRCLPNHSNRMARHPIWT